MQQTNQGTELKMNVHIDPMDGVSMEMYDFECMFYIYPNRACKVSKADMIRLDADNYVAMVDTTRMGSGKIMLRITAYVPDADFPDGLRTEVVTIDTGVTIYR